MPQMAPMSWTMLYLFFITLVLMFTLMNYYLYNPSTENVKSKEMMKPKMNWKW